MTRNNEETSIGLGGLDGGRRRAGPAGIEVLLTPTRW